jgi:hypothetical protein
MNPVTMELTYMVRGADGKEYGPASLEQLSGWAQEGRLQPQAGVKRSDMDGWAAAADFVELQPIFGAPVNTAAATAVAQKATVTRNDPAAAAQMRSGASWFYWVAGLSLINTVSAFSGSSWRFILGLGITQVFDEFGSTLSGGGKFVALVLDLMVAGVFVLFGVFAHKAHKWAFIVGMVLFALDGLIFLLVQDWLGVGFHAFVLFCLFRGFSACRRL